MITMRPWPTALILTATFGAATLLVRATPDDPPETDTPPADVNADGSRAADGSAADGNAADGNAADENAADGPAVRVIVLPNRRERVEGFVVHEDEEYLFVRTSDGMLRRFDKETVAAIIHLVDPGEGHPGVIFMADGRVQRATIIRDDFDEVVYEIQGVKLKIARRFIDHVVLAPSFDERYEAMHSTLDRANAAQFLEFCAWLMAQRRYELAEAELTTLVARHDAPEGQRLLRVARAELALRAEEEMDGQFGPRGKRGEREDVNRPRRAEPTNLISLADVNLIRVYEIDFEHPPAVALSRETIRYLVDAYATDPHLPASASARNALFRAEPLEIVKDLIFPMRARELYDDIEVLTEPHALRLFKEHVHDAWLLNRCSTTRCHGGVDAGRLVLYRKRGRDPRVRYTNLLTLERLEIDPKWPLIDYEHPMNSLIIQHGLPRRHARRPHPTVPGWTPAFHGASDRMVKRTVAWIDAMMKPRAGYPVEYVPVGMPTGPAEPPDDERQGR